MRARRAWRTPVLTRVWCRRASSSEAKAEARVGRLGGVGGEFEQALEVALVEGVDPDFRVGDVQRVQV